MYKSLNMCGNVYIFAKDCEFIDIYSSIPEYARIYWIIPE